MSDELENTLTQDEIENDNIKKEVVENVLNAEKLYIFGETTERKFCFSLGWSHCEIVGQLEKEKFDKLHQIHDLEKMMHIERHLAKVSAQLEKKENTSH